MNPLSIFKKKPKKVYAVTKDNIFTKEEIIAAIQGLEEGQVLDIISTCVTQAGYTSTNAMYIDKNNYPTYTKQIQVINDMFNNRTDYGGEYLRALIKTVVSFMAGEGLSVEAKAKKTEDCITKFLEYNKLLDGSGLLKLVTTIGMEGKVLLELEPQEENIKVIRYSYYITPYVVQENAKDKEEYESVKISTDKLSNDVVQKLKEAKEGNINLKSDKFVYIKVGGSPDRVNNTPPLVANVLTDIENLSRCKYDMRKNNHLFGRVVPIFLVEDIKEAKALQATINSLNNVIGRSYAGTAKQVFYLEPSGKGQEVLAKEMVELLRIVSTNMSIPIHYLAHPELMSNRATAENLLEVVNAGTNQERLIIEEGITNLVKKAMVIGTDRGIEGYVNDPDGFQIKLNFATLALLKQIQEVWLPLFAEEIISKKSLMSRLPGINVNKELALLKKEKEEKMKNMATMFNGGMNVSNKDKQEDQGGIKDDTEEKQTTPSGIK